MGKTALTVLFENVLANTEIAWSRFSLRCGTPKTSECSIARLPPNAVTLELLDVVKAKFRIMAALFLLKVAV